MSEILHSSVQKLVDDPIFLKIIETKLQSIMKDGKIDKKDIPDIMILVIYCTNNLKKLKVSYNELSNVLEEMIMYLLDHFNVVPEESKEEFRSMTKSMVELVMLQPKVQSCFSSCWNFLSCKKH
jgi:hypothetical protein